MSRKKSNGWGAFWLGFFWWLFYQKYLLGVVCGTPKKNGFSGL